MREVDEVAAVGRVDVLAFELDAIAGREPEPGSPAREVVNDVNGAGAVHVGRAAAFGTARRKNDDVELLEFAAIGVRLLPGRRRDARGRDDLFVGTLARPVARSSDAPRQRD